MEDVRGAVEGPDLEMRSNLTHNIREDLAGECGEREWHLAELYIGREHNVCKCPKKHE